MIYKTANRLEFVSVSRRNTWKISKVKIVYLFFFWTKLLIFFRWKMPKKKAASDSTSDSDSGPEDVSILLISLINQSIRQLKILSTTFIDWWNCVFTANSSEEDKENRGRRFGVRFGQKSSGDRTFIQRKGFGGHSRILPKGRRNGTRQKRHLTFNWAMEIDVRKCRCD